MKMLVIGGGGQLGRKIVSLCKELNFETYSTYLTRNPDMMSEGTFFLDKKELFEVDSLIDKVRPDIVIDTVALTDVDYCEMHQKEAWLVNVEGTRKLSLACKRIKAKMVFVSTDFVFDGWKGRYAEGDQPNPLNYYGKTKLEGERAVISGSEDNLIIRTSVIYSWIPRRHSTGMKSENFAVWVVQKLSRGEDIRIVDDQYGSPTLADNLAEGVMEAVEKGLRGLFHLSGKNRLSRFEFSLKLAEHMGSDKSLITRIKSSEFRQVARRPMDSSLDVTRIERALGHNLYSVDKALRLFSQQAWGSFLCL